MNTLEEEHQILNKLAGVQWVPKLSLFYKSKDFEWLTYQFIEGTPLSEVINKVGCTFKMKINILLILIKIIEFVSLLSGKSG